MPMPKRWKHTNLGNVAAFTNGGAWNADEYVEIGIPVVRVTDCQNGTIDISACKYLSKNAYEKYKKHEIIEGDLLVATVGSHPSQPGSVVGRPIVAPKQARGALLNQNAVCIRPVDDTMLNKHFLSHFAKAPSFREYIISCARGSANQVRMAIGLLKEMPIELPPLPTQRKIAAILSAYDDLIENNLRRIKILEEMAQNLYREWFVKFRFPGWENARFVDSPLGRIPEGWEVSSLAEACHLTMGQSPKSEFYNTDGVGLPFHQGVTDFGDRFPSERLYCSVEARIAKKGDILFSVRAPVGRINIANTKMVIGRGLSAIRHKAGFQWFTFHLLKENFKEEDTIGGGTIFKSVTKNDMERITFILPEETLSQQFEQLVEPSEKQIENLTKKNTSLRRTRDLLLPRLISGEVDVSELDIVVPEEAA